jgi:hypothetical protein
LESGERLVVGVLLELDPFDKLLVTAGLIGLEEIHQQKFSVFSPLASSPWFGVLINAFSSGMLSWNSTILVSRDDNRIQMTVMVALVSI